MECLRGDLGADLASSQLVLAGSRSVLAQSDGDVVDLLAGGQGVFNVLPLSGVVSELEAAIVEIEAATPATRSGITRLPAIWPRPKLPSVDGRAQRDRPELTSAR